jgi:hypothetical protein
VGEAVKLPLRELLALWLGEADTEREREGEPEAVADTVVLLLTVLDTLLLQDTVAVRLTPVGKGEEDTVMDPE